ncbi:hypothetical protein ACFLZP_02940, partial [Patescibacteria group bacterium]
VGSKNKSLSFLAKSSVIVGYLFFFFIFLDRYFVHAPVANSQAWGYGYLPMIQFVEKRLADYDRIVITQKSHWPEDYWFFYSQDQTIPEKIVFRNLHWPKDRFEKNTLYVGGTYEIPESDLDPNQVEVLEEIFFLDGQLAFRIVATKGEDK